jgi:hypothetical protein
MLAAPVAFAAFGCLFSLPFYARFLVKTAPAGLADNACLLNLFAEPPY